MSFVYRKTLKGVDELAFKTYGLPLRMVSYLIAVDGEASVDELTARHTHLPSLPAILQGLLDQGFIEILGEKAGANVVDINAMRMATGTDAYMAPQPAPPPMPPMQPMQPTFRATPPPEMQQYAARPMMQPAVDPFPMLETVKANMVRDVGITLGADSGPVIAKIQGCKTKDDLFATMMGIKKIISIYADMKAADKFLSRYPMLMN